MPLYISKSHYHDGDVIVAKRTVNYVDIDSGGSFVVTGEQDLVYYVGQFQKGRAAENPFLQNSFRFITMANVKGLSVKGENYLLKTQELVEIPLMNLNIMNDRDCILGTVVGQLDLDDNFDTLNYLKAVAKHNFYCLNRPPNT